MHRVTKNVCIVTGQSYTSVMDLVDKENRVVYAVMKPGTREQLGPVLNTIASMQDQLLEMYVKLSELYANSKV